MDYCRWSHDSSKPWPNIYDLIRFRNIFSFRESKHGILTSVQEEDVGRHTSLPHTTLERIIARSQNK